MGVRGTVLADDDSDAIELFRDSSASLKALLGVAHPEIKRALDNYDFVQALAVLRQATAKHTQQGGTGS